MNVIECREVCKVYGKQKVLDHVSFTIEENKITALIGRNGAGKTTLLKLIAGFFRETSGDMKVFSECPFNSLNVSANSIFIDDQMTLPTSLTLAELLDEAGRFYENWNDELAHRLFDYFSLNPKQFHHKLSKGMKSTFQMIVGLSARCAMTIFDEPTTGMDAGVRKDFNRVLLKDYMAYPRTIILSSHHLNEIEDIIEDVLLIKDGKKHLHLSMTELKEWAIGLKGDKKAVANWTRNKDILYSQIFGVNQTYVVVRNDFTESMMMEARLSGVEIVAVSPTDVCVYMTTDKKGGIDDVFHTN